MRTAIICQARTSSTRLPRKVLLPLAGKPLLLRCIERLKAAKLADVVVVATTSDPCDNIIVELCQSNGIDVFRGHSTDLLERHLCAAEMVNADIVVKVPSDCPMIDPLIIDEVIRAFKDNCDSIDYMSNLHPATWPDGNDVEVMSRSVVERAAVMATRIYEREHTTPWMWDANPEVVIGNVARQDGQDYSVSHRWTVDYPEDYVLIKAVYEALYSPSRHFTCDDVLEFLAQHPEISSVNAHLCGVNWYRHHMDSLRTIHADSKRIYLQQVGGQI